MVVACPDLRPQASDEEIDRLRRSQTTTLRYPSVPCGHHFVRVETRHPPELPPFEAMKRFVEVDWMADHRRELRERKMSRLREHYVVVEP